MPIACAIMSGKILWKEGGRHAAVVPALPEDQSNVADGHADDNPSYTHPPPHLQPHPFTTIVLPPPQSADTLSIHEYRPPSQRDIEDRLQGSSHSHSTRANPSPPNVPPTSQASPPPQQSPYLAGANAPAPVPATFASIMNAYPTPSAAREEPHSRPGSRDELSASGPSLRSRD